MDESEVSVCVFIIARGNATILFQSMEKTLNDVSEFIQLFVISSVFKAVVPRSDNSESALSKDICSKGIRVIGSIGNHNSTIGVSSNQRRCLGHIMTCACRQDKTQWQKSITHGSIEFRGKTAVAATKCFSSLSSVFFGAPAADACARTIVESTRSAEISPASWKCSWSFSKTPASHHLPKRR